METQTKNEKKQSPGAELALLKKNITDSVMARLKPLIESKELRLPTNYSAGNALQSAWFDILETKDKDKRPALDVCTHTSIANALYKMVIMGLSSAKKQCDFIVYGNKLECQPEYHGNMALARRYGGIKHINPGVIYDGDVFEYSVNVETGRKKIIKHEQLLKNINDDKIRGAYCVLTFDDGSEPWLEVMSMEQIKKAWDKGQMHGKSDAHKDFAGEMAKKTVISRACKLFISSSDDGVLFDDGDRDYAKETRQEKIREESGKKAVNTEDVDYEDINNGGSSRPDDVEKAETPAASQEAVPEPAPAGSDQLFSEEEQTTEAPY